MNEIEVMMVGTHLFSQKCILGIQSAHGLQEASYGDTLRGRVVKQA
jgi:hypothetical protein